MDEGRGNVLGGGTTCETVYDTGDFGFGKEAVKYLSTGKSIV
jgi:hypothetical protein